MDVSSIGLCKEAKVWPKDERNWWLEPKLDGIRMLVKASGGRVTFTSRAGEDFSYAFPVAAQALRSLEVELDAEAVFFDPTTGEVDFHKGSGIVRSGNSVARQQREGYVSLVAFDFLSLAGDDLRRYAIEQRREVLAKLVEVVDCPLIRLVPQGEASEGLHAAYVAEYREGSVLKRKGSAYPRKRSDVWLKVKVKQDADVVILGGEPGKGKYSDTLGALVFGQFKDGQLVARGTCSGMTDAERDEFWRNMPLYQGRVMVITHNGVLPSGGDGFRHPRFSHLRSDKPAWECVWS